MKGWISLHRKILDNPLFRQSRVFSKLEAWVWLLLRANHKEGKVLVGNHMIEVKKGEMITSQHQLCKTFKWGTTKLRAFLNLLQSETMIQWESLPKATRITICNYGSYQNLQNDNETQINGKQAMNKTKIKTNNNVNTGNTENTIKKREQKFINSVCAEGLKRTPNVHPDIVNEFCNYWTEPNKSKTKMKFEMMTTWDTSRRLAKWVSNSEKWGNISSTGAKYEDFQFDSTGYNKIGYCDKCNTSDFYKKPQSEDSRCCNAKLNPRKK